MEDRLNSALALVLFDKLGDAERSEWNAQLSGLPDVFGISWWRNVCPNRTDWLGELRRIDEFETLAICEIDGEGVVTDMPDGVRTITFRRFPRPSQGALRLPTMGLSLVLVSPKDLNDDAASQSLRDWGDFVHFPGIVDANIPGYGLVTPYQNVTRDAPRFLHLYEFPDPDAEAVFQRTRPSVAQRFGGGPGNPGFDHWELHPEIAIDYVNSFTRLDGPSPDAVAPVVAGSLA
ncbi:MAG: hypothetical protein P8J20_03335 [Novosphingobium sp.]|nr:hypothetical protein [Novosphingobium sp.]